MSRPPKRTPDSLATEAAWYIQRATRAGRFDFEDLAEIKRTLLNFFAEKFPPRTRKPKAEKTT